MNNNQRDQKALLAQCKGVFSATGWLNHGTPEDPVPFADKPKDRDSFKGKQFAVAATKTGRLPSSYFQPKHLYLAEGEQYRDRWPYAEQQPEKLKGFGTGDFSKRDEFALAVRMEQHRQQIKHESKLQKAAQERLAAKQGAGGRLPAAAEPLAPQKKPLLFDLVFNSDAQFCAKVKHDTLNPTALSRERKYGALKTMAALAHGHPGAAAKPQYVHRPAIKEEFYRRSNAFFPADCSAAEPQ